MGGERERPWYEAFPVPGNRKPEGVGREEVLEWLEDGVEGFVLVDLRRVDYEGGTIRTSINLPAQSLYPSIPILHAIFSTAGVKTVVFYCASSRGRATRAAGWLDDYLKEKGDSRMRSVVLVGGIKGWVGGGEEFVKMMDGYEEGAWRKEVGQ